MMPLPYAAARPGHRIGGYRVTSSSVTVDPIRGWVWNVTICVPIWMVSPS